MEKSLDDLALQIYFRCLGFPKKTQDLLEMIRSSPPARTPGARRGNVPVWYPSKKMQCIIKAESAKVEFAFLLQAEHDDDILEYGISLLLFLLSTLTDEIASNDQTTSQITLYFALAFVDGLNVNRRLSRSNKLLLAPIGIRLMSKDNGAALLMRLLHNNMG